MSRALAACPPRPAQAAAAPHAAATHAQAESALREAAFVLALTRRVREGIEGAGLMRPAAGCR